VRSERPDRALPLAVLAEELQVLDSAFEQVAAATELGERRARAEDLLRSLDRYIRLETEVLLPVLARTGLDAAAVHRSHDELRALAAQAAEVKAPEDWLPQLRLTFEGHARAQRERIFPAADKLPQAEQEALAYELDEVRNRMRGAYGV